MADMGENQLNISGDPAELRRFQEQANERTAPLSERDPYNGSNPSVLSFHRLLPMPADVAAQDYGASGGGCEWQKAHWGVKWGAASATLRADADTLSYSFETAWYPPLALLQTVSADYPALMFALEFTAPTGHFRDQFTFQHGKTVNGDE